MIFFDFLFAGFAMLDQTGISNYQVCERIETNFGYVLSSKKFVKGSIREGVAAKSKAKSELGLSDIKFGIVDENCGRYGWGEPDENNVAVYPWALREANSSETPPSEIQVLRHEIGHNLFIRFLIPNTRANQYGGDAPDWLDEMAAVSFEDSDSRALRRCELSLYARTSGLLPFKRFLSMAHPEHRIKTSPSQSSGYSPSAPNSNESPIFYAMVSGFDEYLRARLEGRRVIPELASAFRRGKPIGEYIVSQLKLPNLGGNFRELDADFKAWMASDKRMQKAKKCFGQK
jgi:hypothetical protein